MECEWKWCISLLGGSHAACLCCRAQPGCRWLCQLRAQNSRAPASLWWHTVRSTLFLSHRFPDCQWLDRNLSCHDWCIKSLLSQRSLCPPAGGLALVSNWSRSQGWIMLWRPPQLDLRWSYCLPQSHSNQSRLKMESWNENYNGTCLIHGELIFQRLSISIIISAQKNNQNHMWQILFSNSCHPICSSATWTCHSSIKRCSFLNPCSQAGLWLLGPIE